VLGFDPRDQSALRGGRAVSPHNAHHGEAALERIIVTPLANIEEFAQGTPQNCSGALKSSA
jgi:hypothetical protein